LGEDAFLTEEVNDSCPYPLPINVDADFEEVQGEWELDELVDDLHNVWCKHDGKKIMEQKRGQQAEAIIKKHTAVKKIENVNVEQQHNQHRKHDGKKEVEHKGEKLPEACIPIHDVMKDDLLASGEQQFHQPLQPILQPIIEANSPSIRISQKQKADGPVMRSGVVMWSLDWLSSSQENRGGNVSSPTCLQATVAVSEGGKGQPCDDSFTFTSKESKGGNVKRSVGFIKRVAHMPVNDRKEILKILKRHDRKRKTRKGKNKSTSADTSTSESTKNSVSSVNKDWENWVLLNGKPRDVEADVKDIGKTVGVSFQCETSNSFNLLTREARKGWRAVGGGGVGFKGEVGIEGMGTGC
jgi:hypothetical protein